MCALRSEIDKGAKEIADKVVSEIPATPTEFREALPDDIDDLIEEPPEELAKKLPDEVADEISFNSILSNTPLEKYYE